MVTSKALTRMKQFHRIIVEPQEVDAYQRSIDHMGLTAEVVPLDMAYKSRYEMCDELGLTKSSGPGPARNFAWDHSISLGAERHWVMDDNIILFCLRLDGKRRIEIEHQVFWRAMEDFVLRYKNVAMAGPNYSFFARGKLAPIGFNTRIYSCNLIRNDLPQRWRGRYNEDTILSLDILSAGWCTAQFNAFLQKKMPTQALKGGNTGEFYHREGVVQKGKMYADTGTIAKSEMMVKVYPSISKMVYKFSRWHHEVDYSNFKKNQLILDPSFKSENDYRKIFKVIANPRRFPSGKKEQKSDIDTRAD